MCFVLAARCTDDQSELHRNRLEAMYACDREIQGATFFRHVGMHDVAKLLGYAYGRWEQGLRLLKDWHLRYYRSTWRGVPCYHLEWSAIDHVFVAESDLQALSYNEITE